MWYKIVQIIDWFGEIKERYSLIRDFNSSSKRAFIEGVAQTLLEAKITKGDSSYKHEFSKFFGSGLRIKALSGRILKRDEISEIGNVLLSNEQFVRKLVSLGWDTLEIHDNLGSTGLKWPLKKYANIGGFIN